MSEKPQSQSIAFCFDFDGTIADTSSVVTAYFNRLMSILHLPLVKFNQTYPARESRLKTWLDRLEVPLYYLPFLMKKINGIIFSNLDKVKIYPGMHKLITELHKNNHELFIITGNRKNTVTTFLRLHQLNFFAEIIGESPFQTKSRHLQEIMRRHQIEPERIIYVGDETRDIRAAKAAGVKVIAVSWGYDNLSLIKQHQPDYLVNHPDEIIYLLHEINAD